MFRIKDRVFEVESATLFAEIRELEDARKMWGSRNEGIAWFVEVGTAEIEDFDEADEMDGWQPYAECVCQFPQVHWRDIDGQKLEWGESWDEEMGNQRSSLYIFSHCPINDCQLTFARRRNSEFDLQWQGKCDLGWDKDYGDNLPIFIETTVQFIGIAVYEKNVSQAWEMLAQFQDPTDFEEGSIGTYASDSITQFKPRVPTT